MASNSKHERATGGDPSAHSISEPSSIFTNDATPGTLPDSIPKAISRPVSTTRSDSPGVSKLWLLTVACALVSILLFWWSNQASGDRIVVRFKEGHGIKPEDRLRHKGIDIGTVEKVSLNQELRHVEVQIRVSKETRSLICKGTQFWIVRPVLSTDAITGLDTILGAKYIAIEPGPEGSSFESTFEGLENAPALAPRDGAVEIVLDSPTRGGLENGAPLLYRGFRIGQVLSVGLAVDAKTVRTRCAVDPEYRELIRQNTVFWNRSGWRVDIGITGIRLDADTLAQIIAGGIEMATPENAGPIVNTGHRFVLHDKPEDEWLNWKPALAHGPAWSNLESKLLQPSRIALRWQERSFGFRRNKQLLGWCVPLSDGSIICLEQLVAPPSSAIADSSTIEIEGHSFKLTELNRKESTKSKCIRYELPQRLPNTVTVWPKEDLRYANLGEQRSVVVVGSEATITTAIDSARLSTSDETWKIDSSINLGNDALGLPVIDVESGKLLGFIGGTKNAYEIHLLQTGQ